MKDRDMAVITQSHVSWGREIRQYDLNMCKRSRGDHGTVEKNSTWTQEKRALTSAAETPHALLLRHHLCDPKSCAHAQRGVAEKIQTPRRLCSQQLTEGKRGKTHNKRITICFTGTETEVQKWPPCRKGLLWKGVPSWWRTFSVSVLRVFTVFMFIQLT